MRKNLLNVVIDKLATTWQGVLCQTTAAVCAQSSPRALCLLSVHSQGHLSKSALPKASIVFNRINPCFSASSKFI